MAKRDFPDVVGEMFATITGELENASAVAAAAQGVRNRADVKNAVDALQASLRQIERHIVELEALLG